MMAFFGKRMHYLRMRLLVAVLVFTAPLQAGVVYDFTTTVETPRFSIVETGRISVDGQNYRADFDGRGGRDIDIVISRDGDQSAIYIDLQRCRWSYRARLGPTRSSAFFHLPADNGDDLIGTPNVTHHIAGIETVDGFQATKHVIDIEYRLVGVLADYPVRGTVTARATILTVDSLPPLPMRRDLTTGHAAVDEALARINDELHGMIVGHELVVSRAFEGGRPQIERTTTRVKNLHVADLPDSLFAIPPEAEYVQRGPGS